MEENKSWIELLEERIIDSNRVDNCDDCHEFSKYLNEIVTSIFNIEKLNGRNFFYNFTEGKVIQLEVYKTRFLIIIDDFERVISIKVSRDVDRLDDITVGVIRVNDKEFISVEDGNQAKFTRWHLEELLKTTFSSMVQKESLV
ncbi:hypothetical protein [Lysinibacillus sphaericus]|uniref:hypothetical protein n=1 Tax=Lysinibacillus sphaericus TaxID=1421 RepID=UPI001A9F8D8F|nr:hypothetical protein [Lysinibacillus sphaericus]QTB25563.1 hypothetical protein J2D51_14680 [Lysinibacillus sphaericus]